MICPSAGKSVIDRLAEKSGITESGCFEWNASRKPSGYGQLMVDGKMVRAHRVAWVFHNGPIPENLYVLHKCDNPPCWNEAHLFLGTQRENLADSRAKGRERKVRGSQNGKAKLGEVDIPEIRRLYGIGWTKKSIADQFSVAGDAIADVLSGFTWKHVK